VEKSGSRGRDNSQTVRRISEGLVNLTRYSERKKRRSESRKNRATSLAPANSEHFLSGGAIVNDGSNGFFDEGKTA